LTKPRDGLVDARGLETFDEFRHSGLKFMRGSRNLHQLIEGDRRLLRNGNGFDASFCYPSERAAAAKTLGLDQ
jgi:hypothetical protein